MKRWDGKGEIVAVVPDRCTGPGWVNTPVWVYWRDEEGTIHQDCLQPEEQTDLLQEIFSIGVNVKYVLYKAALASLKRREGA
jgi:hypothetical protein